MGRTWLLRGVTVAVFAVLVGAWAVGVAELGDSSPPADKSHAPVSRDEAAVSDRQDSTVAEKTKPRHTRDADPTQEALAEPSPDTTETIPDAPAPTGTTPDPSDPTDEPSDSTPPSHAPSTPPSQPTDDCTELVGVLNCVLDPITGHP
jgi:hypothetical protein